MNFINLILTFLLATSCLKVGEYEEFSHQRSIISRKNAKIDDIQAILSEKCLAINRKLVETKCQRKQRRTPISREKVGPFYLFFRIALFFFFSIKQAQLSVKRCFCLPYNVKIHELSNYYYYSIYYLKSTLYNSLVLKSLISRAQDVWGHYICERKASMYLNNIIFSPKKVCVNATKKILKIFRNLRNSNKNPLREKTELLDRSRSTVNSDKDHRLILKRSTKSIILAIKCIFEESIKMFVKVKKMLAITIDNLLIRGNIEPHPGPRKNIETFSALTYNCNGLGDKSKLKRLLNKLDPLVSKDCVILLQETHLINTDYLKMIWKHKYISNGYRTNSAGVIILFNSKYDIKFEQKDDEGRKIIVVLEDDSNKLIVANVYFPNDHKVAINFAEDLYTDILGIQNIFDDHITICGGDFNVCLEEEDKLNRNSNQYEKNLARTIQENNNIANLSDSFRSIHSTGGYTWRRGNIYSRLDYLFVSSDFIKNIVSSTVDWALDSSDHASIRSTFLSPDTPTRGPGIIKINSRILDNPEITNQIAHEINEMLGQMDDAWNPHTKLEFLKVAIRSIFSNKTSEIRNVLRNELSEREISLDQMQKMKIKLLEKYKNSDNNDRIEKNKLLDNSISFLKDEVATLRNKLSNNLSFAARAKWYEQGEKSNKYFLNLNKIKQSQKLIGKIKNGSTEATGQIGVEKCIRDFYSDLYSKSTTTKNIDNSFFDQCPKLNEDNRNNIDKDLTLNDLYESLKTCKESAPGPDGIPYEIYKKFWTITGPILHNAWQYSLDIGQLPPSHLESVITLLPKEGKDCSDIKNWRPITLSNCDLKIVTKALSNKIASALDTIIDKSQTAYVPGRSVSDNLRTNFYFKQYCDLENKDAVLISLDAKKPSTLLIIIT